MKLYIELCISELSDAAAPNPHHGWCGDCLIEVMITISLLDNNNSPSRVHSLTFTWNIYVLSFTNSSFWSKWIHVKSVTVFLIWPNTERSVCPPLSNMNLHKFCQVISTCAFHSCLKPQRDDIKSISPGNWRRPCPGRRTTFIKTFPDCSP